MVAKKNHRRSLNKSLGRLSQKSSVEVPVDRLTVMNDIFKGGDKKGNHRRSLNKSLKRLSQRSSVEVHVDRLSVMNDIFKGGEKESQAILKQVTRETVTKEQCRGACRSTYGDE